MSDKTRNNTSNRRSRGRGGASRKSGNQRSQVFDSNGPDVRIRGTAHQVCEKYLALAKDASSVGDRILAESYMQHAEHYQRIISSWNQDTVSKENKPANASPEKQSEKQKGQSDLSLPDSILGDVSKLDPANKRTEERTVEEDVVA